jgi:hypothetical protein
MPKVTKTNYFTELDLVDVTKHIEKKGKFSYLSWAYAVRELKKRHPSATWTVHEYGEHGNPFVKTECGFFVKVTVNVDGIDATQIHPVLDHQNKPLTAPNSFQINTSIQRCLAKAIALHGLGIHLYAGEDLPPSPPLSENQAQTLLDSLKDNDKEGLLDTVKHQISIGQINQGNFHKAMEHYSNT